jgi:ABC-type polysaccharide/polyol phosphate export permease
LRFTLSGTFHFLIALGLVLAISWVWSPVEIPVGLQNYSIAVATLIPAVVLLFIFAWAVSVIFGLINVYFTDTQHLAEVALQMLFYLTPIIYKRDLLQTTPFWWVIEYNPVVLFLDMIRLPLLQGIPASTETFMAATAVVAVTSLFAGLCMARLSKKLIFQL